MRMTTENPPEDTVTENEQPLPDYAAAVAECGDPQPTLDALTADLDAQTPPVIDPDPDAEGEDVSAEPEDGGGDDD